MKFKHIALSLFIALQGTGAQAQHSARGTDAPASIEYQFSIGTRIGGAAPLSFPATIRKIRSYSPAVPFLATAKLHYPIDARWGISTGLTFEGKGMNTGARVKGYKTAFNASNDPSQNIRGYFTGDISTNVHNIYLTLPLLASYTLSRRWTVEAGPYISLALNKRFYGEAANGYMRHNDPTGPRINIDKAAYDFSNDVRTWDVGMSAGGHYRFAKKYFALAQLDYGFNSIMKTGFETISFGLHNVFLNLGAGIRL